MAVACDRQPLSLGTSAAQSLAEGLSWLDGGFRPARRDGQAAEPAGSGEEREMVRRALQTLDPQTRSILVLRYFAELDSTEIGKILELPAATVRGRLRRRGKNG